VCLLQALVVPVLLTATLFLGPVVMSGWFGGEEYAHWYAPSASVAQRALAVWRAKWQHTLSLAQDYESRLMLIRNLVVVRPLSRSLSSSYPISFVFSLYIYMRCADVM
jgi:hypothetical protein